MRSKVLLDHTGPADGTHAATKSTGESGVLSRVKKDEHHQATAEDGIEYG